MLIPEFRSRSPGLLSETSLQSIAQLPLRRLVVTNTLPQAHRDALCPDQKDEGFDIIDISTTIAESIRRTHNGESMYVPPPVSSPRALSFGI